MARKRVVLTPSYRGGTPPNRNYTERDIQRCRDILDSMITWGEKFGTEYEFKNNPRGSTVRADYIGRPMRFVNRKIGPENMLQSWDEARGIVRKDANGKELKNLSRWTQEVKKFREDVFGLKFDAEGNLTDYESYGAAVVFEVIKGVMSFFKELYELWAGVHGKGQGKDIVGIKDRIKDKIDHRRMSHLHGLDRSDMKSDTIINIDLDAFSGSQKGAIMRSLSGEASLKDIAALPLDVRKMLDRISNDTNRGCAVILTCNSPQSVAICQQNLSKLHEGKYVINANNGAWLYAVDSDGALHEIHDKRIDKDVMISLCDFFTPGRAGVLPTGMTVGGLGGDNTKLMWQTPVEFTVKDVNNIDVKATAKINWNMVVVDKAGHKHTIPIEPLYIPGPNGPAHNPNAKDIVDKLSRIDKDNCLSITFQPDKNSIKSSCEAIIQNQKNGRPITKKEQDELLYKISQAGASAFYATFLAENSQLSAGGKMKNMQIIPRSDGGFNIVPPGCSSFGSSEVAMTELGFNRKQKWDLLSTNESMSKPVQLKDSRLARFQITRSWDQVLHSLIDRDVVHNATPVHEHVVEDAELGNSGKPMENRRLYVLGDDSLTKRKLGEGIIARILGGNRKANPTEKVNKVPKNENMIGGIANAVSNAITHNVR